MKIGDRFSSPEEAGRDAIAEANPLSIAENKEHGGTIEREVTPLTDFFGNPILDSSGNQFEAVRYFAKPSAVGSGRQVEITGDATTTVGDYHAHGDYSLAQGGEVWFRAPTVFSQTFRASVDDFNSDQWSTDDIANSITLRDGTAAARSVYGETYRSYLGTPSGAILERVP